MLMFHISRSLLAVEVVVVAAAAAAAVVIIILNISIEEI